MDRYYSRASSISLREIKHCSIEWEDNIAYHQNTREKLQTPLSDINPFTNAYKHMGEADEEKNAGSAATCSGENVHQAMQQKKIQCTFT